MVNLKKRLELSNRRDFLKQSAGLAVTIGGLQAGRSIARSTPAEGVTFSFGTYGMQTLRTEVALQAVADIGYDGIELCVRPEWDADPQKLNGTRRAMLRDQLQTLNLKLTALMEHLIPTAERTQQMAILERLRWVAELAGDLAPANPPLVQTVLGGGEWSTVRGLYRDQLGQWLEILSPAGVTLAIKPHRGGALSRPSEAVELIHDLGKPQRLKLVYDYSHYAFRNLSLEETIAVALPYTAHVAIKDAVQDRGKVRFALPGESGTFDYQPLFSRFYRGGYRGDFCCEVSSMVFGAPNYDPIAAAKNCYQKLAPLFTTADVPRAG